MALEDPNEHDDDGSLFHDEHIAAEQTIHELLDVETIQWDQVMAKIQSENSGVDQVDQDTQKTVLSKAICRLAPVDVVHAILEKAPREHVSEINPVTGLLPLHEACHPTCNKGGRFCVIRKNSKHHQIINVLIDAYPKASIVPTDDENMLPLHILLQHRPPLELVVDLISVMEEQTFDHKVQRLLEHQDVEQQTPLHVAIEHYATENLILFLIEQCPESVRQRGKENYLPLHNAVYFGCTHAVLDKLFFWHIGDSINSDCATAFDCAFHRDVAHRWESGYKPDVTFPDGTSPDGFIQGPPMGLLSQKDMVDIMLKKLPTRLNNFAKTRNANTVKDKTSVLTKQMVAPILKMARACKKQCRKPAPDIDTIIQLLQGR